MTYSQRRRAGFSLTELIVYVAILCVAVAMFVKFMMGFMKTAKTSENKMLGSAELRGAIIKTEADLYEANEFTAAAASSATFICDMLRNPAWDRDADADGDGVPNIKDTDTDNDAQLKFSLPRDQQWSDSTIPYITISDGIAAVRRQGLRYVVISSLTRDAYHIPWQQQLYPKIAGFYDEVERTGVLLRRVAPARGYAQGPRLELYDIGPVQ